MLILFSQKGWRTSILRNIYGLNSLRITPILTANLKVRQLIVLSNGTASCAEILACICILDILQCERGHTSITPHHYVSIQALDGSRKWLGLVKTTQNIHISCFPQQYCAFTFMKHVSVERCVTWKTKAEHSGPLMSRRDITLMK